METAIKDIHFEKLLNKALKNGGDFSEIYIERKQGTSIVSEARRIERYVSTTENGVGLRVVIGDKSAYAHTNDLSTLDELADTVAAAVKKAPSIPPLLWRKGLYGIWFFPRSIPRGWVRRKRSRW